MWHTATHPLASACPSCTLQVYKSHPLALLVLSSSKSSVKLLLKKKKSKMQWTGNTECQVCLNIALLAHPKREADFCPVMDSQQALTGRV